MTEPVIIVGGGASGLSAAIAAAEEGAAVLILEKKEQTGKKILLTGNGHCNFTNRHITPEAYYTHEPSFIERFLCNFQTEDALSLFKGLGMFASFRGDCAYPSGMQASAVLSALMDRIRTLSITIRTGVNVNAVRVDRTKRLFTVSADVRSLEGPKKAPLKQEFCCRKLILAAGTEAGVRDPNAYTAEKILKNLGHHVYPFRPALTKLCGKEGFEAFWDGVRHSCTIRLTDLSGQTVEESGEVQFTKDGISGIPVFQLSHPAGERILTDGFCEIQMDLLPAFSQEELLYSLNFLKNSPYNAGRPLFDILSGFLPKKLIKPVFRAFPMDPGSLLSSASEDDLKRLVHHLKDFSYRVYGTGDALSSQAMSGGADLREVSDQMESRIVPGLYLTGELLDADGKCGGFNLHFAWGTGSIAGKSAAHSLKDNV